MHLGQKMSIVKIILNKCIGKKTDFISNRALGIKYAKFCIRFRFNQNKT